MAAEEKKIRYQASDKEQHQRYRKIFGKEVPKDFKDFQNLKYYHPDKWEELKKKRREATKKVDNSADSAKKNSKKPLEPSEKDVIIKSDNVSVRKWYVDKVSKITESIDKNLSMEERAKAAFEARNRIRTEARNMMIDEKTRKLLDKERPNKTFEELIESKMKRKGMTREEAIEDIFRTATETNADVNKELGIGEE